MSAQTTVSAAIGFFSLCAASHHADAAISSFQGLGTAARANAISADGSTVVGNGFIWRSGVGPTTLPFSRANSISADGSIIVGRNGSRAVRWDGHTLEDLNVFNWGEYSTANGVSADGTVIVGNGATDGPFSETAAFMWTETAHTQGMSTSITGGTYEGWGAMAASSNGSVIVGNHGYNPRAFRWTSGNGLVDLFPDARFSSANAVSSNGTIIAATVGIDLFSERHAMRIVGADTQDIGVLSGGVYSDAHGISADGSTIVGMSDSETGERAVVWTSEFGLRRISDALMAAGVTNHAGWTLEGATAVSADGNTIIGYGVNAAGFEESWIATIPSPPSAAALGCVALFALRRRRA